MSLPTAQQVREAAIRQAINALLITLTDKQLTLIHRIHDNAPWKGLVNCPDEKLNETYELIRRTKLQLESKP